MAIARAPHGLQQDGMWVWRCGALARQGCGLLEPGPAAASLSISCLHFVPEERKCVASKTDMQLLTVRDGLLLLNGYEFAANNVRLLFNPYLVNLNYFCEIDYTDIEHLSLEA
ncbi:hypothetical protein DUI87_10019 [Hirundo rustica rustica]|uniref:Uncharacterized protein n=1 Tax=Hirundo rustica rustica TaxID=333673 RepID=A0A3M0KIN3_HIRRU|nr:hypothetical protein DUI87_10019 [Hirundo rustica rustica]